jgi:3-hydroxybutyryl-CoA dehydrogenase
MQIVVLTNDAFKEEFLATGVKENVQIEWVTTEEKFLQYPDADAFFDLLFQHEAKRIDILSRLNDKPVFINDVLNKNSSDSSFIRFNGWPTFLKRSIFEASYQSEEMKENAEKIIIVLNRKIEWTPNIPGFITARVLASIINEAYFALQEGVSSKEEIDIAMTLGTNYPFGPFEWSKKIGLRKIFDLLTELSKSNSRYEPSSLLKEEAFL